MTRTRPEGYLPRFLRSATKEKFGGHRACSRFARASAKVLTRDPKKEKEKKEIFSPASPQKPYKHINSNLFT